MSEIIESVLDDIERMHKAGVINTVTVQKFKKLANVPEPKHLSQKKIQAIRKKTHLSQAMFARFLNVTVSTVQKWEQGVNEPAGPALVLLNLVDKQGIKAVAL
ncbi:Antitoxin igA-2 (plasmid) [Piscirickettsia salmonis]|uniref:DNA-binding protein n=1 Tax=Piscirickettsia salmonis TaxID=1238 RepID=A0A1L6TI07_PISSA|nr:helix-turn-helix domain-containing protein [Piscirickettsia salmonis]AKP74922.2 hypothetical protein PSLF89_1p114 [Piscirickettsia salmonis LF-89 = ATCC VR-1361]ALB24664.1 DNA-binding protein [Piscirickettsia salmonis]ALY04527.1 hypothetical protein AWE47_16605 [Piscirickettsia salmonis]AMA43894.1 hypothetical protein AWJ11_16015 [Piscirickettsia salmonis]AOS37112.1 hypothetical protein AVM72_17345 [Piscirickettsia salmonis]